MTDDDLDPTKQHRLAEQQASIDRAVGMRIRELRISAALGVDQLSARTRISASDIERIENGQMRAQPPALVTIAAALGVSLASLFAGLQ